MSVYFTITHIVPAYTESLRGCLVNYVHVRFLLKARLIRPSYCRDTVLHVYEGRNSQRQGMHADKVSVSVNVSRSALLLQQQ